MGHREVHLEKLRDFQPELFVDTITETEETEEDEDSARKTSTSYTAMEDIRWK